MISFIVIGKNEETNLKRAIEGIYKTVAFNKLDQYEIIYVDSKSTDHSIEVAKEFPGVRIFLVTGKSNAAIGRNIGAKEAKGDIYFFIDADMEIHPAFLAGVYNAQTGKLQEDFISGNLIDIIDGKVIRRNDNPRIPGGVFLVTAKLWEQLQGMRTKYTTGETYDFGLRAIEQGIRFKRTKDVITNHYTIPDMHSSRIWKTVRSKYIFYPRCVLWRDHPFTRATYSHMYRNDKTFLLMIAALVATIFFPKVGIGLWALYLISIILRTLNNRHRSILEMMGYYLVADLLNLLYLFTFFPSKKKEEYVRVI